MLKEGWDVTTLHHNSLRTRLFNLREQTIGRGCDCPTERTGVDKVDKLTIVAHDKFQEIAMKPISRILLLGWNIIEVDPDDLPNLRSNRSFPIGRNDFS